MLANSGFGHSGNPSPFPSLPSLPSPPSFPFPVGPTPKPAMGSRKRCRLTQWGLGQSPSRQLNDLVHISVAKRSSSSGNSLFLCIFITINLNFYTNTRLLSSRLSVSLRAKYSVWSRAVTSPGFCVRGHRFGPFGVVKRPKIITVCRTTPCSTVYS